MYQPRIDVRNTPFKRAARGFDPDEVQAFLEALAPDYDEAHAERDRLRDALGALVRQMDDARETDRSLMRMLASAEEDARQQAAAAREEAGRILTAAEARAAALVASLEEKRRELDVEISAILARRRRAADGLLALIDEVTGRSSQTSTATDTPHVPPASAEPREVLVYTPSPEPVPADPAPNARSSWPPPGRQAPALAPHDGASRLEDVVPAGSRRGLAAGRPPATELVSQPFSADAEDAVTEPPVPPTVQIEDVASGDGVPSADTALEEKACDGEADASSPFVGLSEEAAAVLGPAAREVLARLEPEPPSPLVENPAPETQAAPAEPEGPRGFPRRLVLVTAALGAFVVVAVLAWPGRTEAPPAPAEPPAHAAPVAAPEPERPSSSATEVPAPAVPSDPLVVRLTASRSCWVRVAVDGRTESRVLAEGEEVIRGAQRSVELRVGDASALTVEVNGKTLPPLGRDGQVVDRRFEAESPAS